MVSNDILKAIPLNDYKKVCGTCAIYIILFVIFLLASVTINRAFIYFHWCL